MKTFLFTFIVIDVAVLRVLGREHIAFQALSLFWLSILAGAWFYSHERLFWNLFWGLSIVEVVFSLDDFFGDPK